MNTRMTFPLRLMILTGHLQQPYGITDPKNLVYIQSSLPFLVARNAKELIDARWSDKNLVFQHW